MGQSPKFSTGVEKTVENARFTACCPARMAVLPVFGRGERVYGAIWRAFFVSQV
jgi:hypothetical protein